MPKSNMARAPNPLAPPPPSSLSNQALLLNRSKNRQTQLHHRPTIPRSTPHHPRRNPRRRRNERKSTSTLKVGQMRTLDEIGLMMVIIHHCQNPSSPPSSSQHLTLHLCPPLVTCSFSTPAVVTAPHAPFCSDAEHKQHQHIIGVCQWLVIVFLV